jgi:hypothetical protein
MSRLEEENSEAVGPTQDVAIKSGSVITVSSTVDEGLGCLLGAAAFAIVLWAIATFGPGVIKVLFGG